MTLVGLAGSVMLPVFEEAGFRIAAEAFAEMPADFINAYILGSLGITEAAATTYVTKNSVTGGVRSDRTVQANAIASEAHSQYQPTLAGSTRSRMSTRMCRPSRSSHGAESMVTR